jgi:hypothetical protein
MSITTKATGRSSRFDLTLPSHQERNITVNADTREGLLAALKNELRTNSGATPLHSFVFGGCQHHAPFVKTYGEPDSPLTWVQCHSGQCHSGQSSHSSIRVPTIGKITSSFWLEHFTNEMPFRETHPAVPAPLRRRGFQKLPSSGGVARGRGGLRRLNRDVL